MTQCEFTSMWKVMSKYSFEVDSDSRKEDLTCQICKKIMIDACHSTCGCQYCHNCIAIYLKDEDKYCPGNKDQCSEEYLVLNRDVTKNIRMNNKISKMKVLCPKKSCRKTIELSKMEEHLQLCGKQRPQCPYVSIGCNADHIIKEDILTHLDSDTLIHAEILMKYINKLQGDFEMSKLETSTIKETSRIKQIQLLEILEQQNKEIEGLQKESRKKNNGIHFLEEKIKKLENNMKLKFSKIISNEKEKSGLDMEKDPLKKSMILKEQGNSFFIAGEYDNAFKLYMEALEMCPIAEKLERLNLLQKKAETMENLGRIDQILLPLNEALKLFSENEKVLNQRSICFETNGRYREALVDITAVAVFDYFKTPEYLNRMELLVKKICKKEMEELKSTERFILQSDRYISTYLKSFPNDPLLCSLHCDVDDEHLKAAEKCFELYKREDFELCFLEVRNLLSLLSPSPLSFDNNNYVPQDVLCRLLLLRATFYGLSCREELSLKDLNTVIDNRRASPAVTVNALIKRAMLMMIMDDMAGVENSFNNALEIDKNCPEIYYYRGIWFENSNQYDEAIDDFTKALELNPTYSFSAVHLEYNEYQERKQIDDEFIDNFTTLINQFPQCAECHEIYAQVLLDELYLPEAEKVCEKILKVYPGMSTVLMTLAMVKLSQEKISEAKRILQKAIELDPKYPLPYHTLATMFIQESELEEAIKLMEEAVKYARNKPELENFITTTEDMRAQWKVSVDYNIHPSEIFARMINGVNMQNDGLVN